MGVLPWVAAGAMVVAGMIAAAGAGAHPGSGSGTFSGPAQAAALVALAAVVASLARPRRPEFARLVAARIRNVGGSVNPGPARGRRERGGNGRVSRHVRAPRIVPNPDWSGPGGAW
ncbi:MAG: hypothetical protein HYU28_01305 [Actinobacteria bacterium]|nr:hypothetical protein [Actinomycetota bacterium]